MFVEIVEVYLCARTLTCVILWSSFIKMMTRLTKPTILLTFSIDLCTAIFTLFFVSLFPGATAYSDAFYGQGNGPIYFSNFLCSGTENSIFNCTNGGLNQNIVGVCRGHMDDAGVRCAQGIFVVVFLFENEMVDY